MASANIFLKDDGSPDYERSVREAATQMGINPDVAASIMRTESGGNAKAQSPKGAVGLMQLMPDTAKQYGADPSDPSQNITAGLTYFKSLMDRYKGNTPLALAAYNAGPGNVDAFLGGSGRLPAETQAYVQKITGKPLMSGETGNTNQWQSSGNGWQTPSQIYGHVKDELTDPQNMPTVGGIMGGLLTAGLSKFVGPEAGAIERMLTTAIGSGIGGSSGNAVQQQMNNNTGMGTNKPMNVDPLEAGGAGGEQALWEMAGQLPGYVQRRIGAGVYANAAGLTRPGFSQNFPTAAQEGLEGGRFSAPIVGPRGAQRVFNRTAPQQPQLIANAMANGAPGANIVDIARRGMAPVVNAMRKDINPKEDTAAASNYIRDIIEGNSRVTPAQVVPPSVVQRPTGAVNALGQPITQSQPVPGYTIPKQVNPIQYDLADLQARKQRFQDQAANAFRATNADKLANLKGQVDRGAAIGAQKILEDQVPGLQQLNRKLQGLTGLNQSLNPSFRTPEELQAMGVAPEVASAMTSDASKWTVPRMVAETIAGLTGAAAGFEGHSWPLAAGALATGHMVASPLGRRILGAGMYVNGRMTPMLARGIHVAANSAMQPDDTPEDPQITALKLAIANGQIK